MIEEVILKGSLILEVYGVRTLLEYEDVKGIRIYSKMMIYTNSTIPESRVLNIAIVMPRLVDSAGHKLLMDELEREVACMLNLKVK